MFEKQDARGMKDYIKLIVYLSPYCSYLSVLDSRDLMREGSEVSGICGPLVQDPVPEGPPLNLVIYMYLRIFAYSSNILNTSFAPMV